MPTAISLPTRPAATAIPFTPTPSIASNQVQAAIAELAQETVDLSSNQTVGGIKSFTSGEVALINATRNLLSFNIAGTAAPSFNARSAGTKVLLYPVLTATQSDFALGIANATLWSSIPQATVANRFSWYGGVTELAFLRGDGLFYVPRIGIGTATPGSITCQVAGGMAITSGTGAAVDPGSGSLSVENTLTTGAIKRRTVTVLGNYNITPFDSLIFFDASTSNPTATLPSVTGSAGRLLRFIRIDNSNTNTATILTPASNQLINGNTTLALTTQYASVDLESNGSSWFIA